jgi:hypothetical protein
MDDEGPLAEAVSKRVRTTDDDLTPAADTFRLAREAPSSGGLIDLRLNGDDPLDLDDDDSYYHVQARRPTGRRWMVAAVVFIAVILGGPQFHYPDLAWSLFRSWNQLDASTLTAIPLPQQLVGLIAAERTTDLARSTAGSGAPDTAASVAPTIRTVVEPPPPIAEPVRSRSVAAPPAGQPVMEAAREDAAVPSSPAPVAPPPATSDAAAPARAENAPPSPRSEPESPAVPAVATTSANDEQGVKLALQRYRSAYERLDAQSARTVWPSVNEAALARAFDSLQSQTLTFTACDVNFHGPVATATCEGSTRFTPRFGSRVARVEPRVWTFTLRKRGADWQIDSVRAER